MQNDFLGEINVGLISIRNIVVDCGTTTFDLYRNGVYESTDTVFKVLRTERAILRFLGY